MTERSTVSYSDNNACPTSDNVPVPALKVPVIPNCGVNDSTSSEDAKLPLMVTVAVSISVSSRSSIERPLVMSTARPFSVYGTGTVAMLARTGGSLTGMICTSLDSRLLSSSPSLTTKSMVRVSAEGLSLVFW